MSEIDTSHAGGGSWGEAAKAAQAAGAPAPAEGGCDFGLETGNSDLEGRDFQFGDQVKIARRAHVIDKERENEGPLAKLEGPLEADVTGAEGTVVSGSYYDEKRDDEMVPMETKRGGLLYVPSKKLERAEAPVRTGKTSFAMTERLRPDEKMMLAKFNEYQAKALAAQLDGKPFPKFSTWLDEAASAAATPKTS